MRAEDTAGPEGSVPEGATGTALPGPAQGSAKPNPRRVRGGGGAGRALVPAAVLSASGCVAQGEGMAQGSQASPLARGPCREPPGSCRKGRGGQGAWHACGGLLAAAAVQEAVLAQGEAG